jgi:hypothetical protein
MRALILVLLGLTISTGAFSQEKEIPVCSIFYAKSVKAKLLPSNTLDKYKHCAVSCMLALRCGALDSANIGILKEIWDLFTPGNAEIDDLKADLIGIRFKTTKMATTDKECNNRCDEYNWNDL